MKKSKKIPEFKNETEERKFWHEHNTTDYIDWSKAKKISFPNLKHSVKSISQKIKEEHSS